MIAGAFVCRHHSNGSYSQPGGDVLNNLYRTVVFDRKGKCYCRDNLLYVALIDVGRITVQ